MLFLYETLNCRSAIGIFRANLGFYIPQYPMRGICALHEVKDFLECWYASTRVKKLLSFGQIIIRDLAKNEGLIRKSACRFDPQSRVFI